MTLMPPNTVSIPPPHIVSAAPTWALPEIRQILSEITDIRLGMARVAKRYVECLDRDPEFFDWLRMSAPELSTQALNRLERAGRGQIDVRLLNGGTYASYLERLPLSDQRRVLDDGVSLLTTNGDELKIQVHNASSDQIKQIFAFDHIRPLEEQRLWIEEQRVIAKKKAETTPLKPVMGHAEVNKRKGTVTFQGPVTLTASELLEYFHELMK